ncbi:MAG: hypothetical protein N3B10_14660 [Armatimonadetes bacterium]|nr:hypothetical protein [Armatimonadota bacterium]
MNECEIGYAKAVDNGFSLFAEWRSLISTVYSSAVGDDELFLRHTYLALFARVLAFVALKRRAPSDDELTGLVTGETFERLGLENFVTDDFFAWVVNDEQTTRSLLHSLATRLTVAYDLSAINEDLLKELYRNSLTSRPVTIWANFTLPVAKLLGLF